MLPLRSEKSREEEDKLEHRDLVDLSAYDITGRRCKTGDWGKFGEGEDHVDLFRR